LFSGSVLRVLRRHDGALVRRFLLEFRRLTRLPAANSGI
jgi:hypothetical protein